MKCRSGRFSARYKEIKFVLLGHTEYEERLVRTVDRALVWPDVFANGPHLPRLGRKHMGQEVEGTQRAARRRCRSTTYHSAATTATTTRCTCHSAATEEGPFNSVADIVRL